MAAWQLGRGHVCTFPKRGNAARRAASPTLTLTPTAAAADFVLVAAFVLLQQQHLKNVTYSELSRCSSLAKRIDRQRERAARATAACGMSNCIACQRQVAPLMTLFLLHASSDPPPPFTRLSSSNWRAWLGLDSDSDSGSG